MAKRKVAKAKAPKLAAPTPVGAPKAEKGMGQNTVRLTLVKDCTYELWYGRNKIVEDLCKQAFEYLFPDIVIDDDCECQISLTVTQTGPVERSDEIAGIDNDGY